MIILKDIRGEAWGFSSGSNKGAIKKNYKSFADSIRKHFNELFQKELLT